MAREIVTNVLCDLCLAEDVRAEARSFEVGVDGKPRTIELCESHEVEVLKPMVDVLERFGHRLPSTAARPARAAAPALDPSAPRKGAEPAGGRDLACLACGSLYGTPSGLAGHMVGQHGMPKAATLTFAYGDRCPLCGHRGSARGLGMHTGSVHHDSVPRAFTEAREAGDEFGVVAERTAFILRQA